MWQFFREQVMGSRGRIIPLGVLCLVLVSLIDWITGPEVSVSAFYLIPAILLSWFVGKKAGYVVGVVHDLVWFSVNVSAGAPLSSPLLYWNAFTHLVLFLVVVWITQLAKNLSVTIEKLIQARTADLQRELELRRQSEEAIHALANQLAIAEDEERRRLGHDIHDSLGQNLTLLKLRLEAMGRAPTADPATQASVGQSLKVLDDLIQSSRTLTFSLYPSMLDDLGLGPTLRRYAEQLTEQIAVEVNVGEHGEPIKLPVPVAGFLFRAVKELINNSIKHGPAKEVLAQIWWRADGIRIVVDDDGRGFFAPQISQAKMKKGQSLRSDGLGLAWIAERLHSFGGTLQTESIDGGGARVVIDMPLVNEQEPIRSEVHVEPVAG